MYDQSQILHAVLVTGGQETHDELMELLQIAQRYNSTNLLEALGRCVGEAEARNSPPDRLVDEVMDYTDAFFRRVLIGQGIDLFEEAPTRIAAKIADALVSLDDYSDHRQLYDMIDLDTPAPEVLGAMLYLVSDLTPEVLLKYVESIDFTLLENMKRRFGQYAVCLEDAQNDAAEVSPDLLKKAIRQYQAYAKHAGLGGQAAQQFLNSPKSIGLPIAAYLSFMQTNDDFNELVERGDLAVAVQTIAGVVCISQEGCQNLQATAMDCITKLMLDDERAHRAGAFMSRLVSEIVNEQV